MQIRRRHRNPLRTAKQVRSRPCDGPVEARPLYLYTPMASPADYGFIEDTLGEDGDPLDAMVLLPEPVVFPWRHRRSPTRRHVPEWSTGAATTRCSAFRPATTAGTTSRTSATYPPTNSRRYRTSSCTTRGPRARQIRQCRLRRSRRSRSRDQSAPIDQLRRRRTLDFRPPRPIFSCT